MIRNMHQGEGNLVLKYALPGEKKHKFLSGGINQIANSDTTDSSV